MVLEENIVLVYYSSHGLSHEEILKILNQKCYAA